MSDMFEQDSQTVLLNGTGELTDDYEIQHILSVANAYLEAGHIGDAVELLQEAREADADHPGVHLLARKLTHAQAVPVADEPEDAAADTAPDVLVHFTSPLPGTESLSPANQRLSRAIDQYYYSGRVNSALDLSLIFCAVQPDYIPAFVRLAELQLSHGLVDQARDTWQTLHHYYATIGEQEPWLVRSIGVALNPSDTSALLAYAQMLVESGEQSGLDPFVPEAIARAVDMNPASALELAEKYLHAKPDVPDVRRLYLSVVSTAGDEDTFLSAARDLVTRTSPLDLQAFRLAAELGGDGWLENLETVAGMVRTQPGRIDEVIDVFLGAVRNSGQDTQLVQAALLHAGERWDESLSILNSIRRSGLSSPAVVFVSRFLEAHALLQTGDDRANDALLEAAHAAYDKEVESFANSTTLFGVSARPSDILRLCAGDSADESSIESLLQLRDANPEQMDIRIALADAYIRSGDVFNGLKELRQVAEEAEEAGDIPGMVRAMRRISEAVPSNADIKAKLIEGYLRRGVLDEAVDELERVGAIYVERGRGSDAIAAFTRAAEIASTLGAFERGNQLYARAVDTDRDNVAIRHSAVAYYLQTGSIEQATDTLREVVRIVLAANEQDEAVAALHQIIALAPNDPDAYHKLGEVLTSLSEYTQAERVYRRLAALTPEDPVLQAKQSALAVLAASN